MSPPAWTGKLEPPKGRRGQAKGGAFDPGSFQANGVQDQDAFQRAIAIFSKKRVEYA
jgi:hypothetical protein